MEKREPQSLLNISGDVVLKYHPRYQNRLFHSTKDKHGLDVDVPVCDRNIKNCLNLLSTEEVKRLSENIALKIEMKKSGTNNILHYLIVENPTEGMFYGGLYAMRRLFDIAHRSYLKQHKIETEYNETEYNDYKTLMGRYVIKGAIGGGDFEIYEKCLEYASPVYVRSYEIGMTFAIEYDNRNMFKYFLENGANIKNAICAAMRYERPHLIRVLIDECYKRNEDVVDILHTCFIRAIVFEQYRAFEHLLRYKEVDVLLQSIIKQILQRDRLTMFDFIIEYLGYRLNKRNNKGLTTNNGLTKNGIAGLKMLLKHDEYDNDDLNKMVMMLIKLEAIAIDDKKKMIDIVIDYIPYEYIERDLLLQTAHDINLILYEYLRRKFTSLKYKNYIRKYIDLYKWME